MDSDPAIKFPLWEKVMSDKKKDFNMKDVVKEGQDNLMLNLQRDGDDYYASSVLKRKTFLGMFPRWVVVADLLDPVRDVDKEIEAAKNKLVELKAKREVKLREFYTIAAAIPQSFEKKAFSLTGKPSNSKPVRDVFGEKKKDKPATKTVELDCMPARPEQKGNQNNTRKN